MRGFARTSLTVALSVAAMAAASFAADTVEIRLGAGRTYQGTIVASGDTHAYSLEGFTFLDGLSSTSTFSVSLKAAKGSALLPDLFLEDPDAVNVTSSLAPFRKDGATSVTVRDFAAAKEGRFVLRVAGKSASTGGYVLKVTLKPPKLLPALVPILGTTGELDVFFPEEADVKITTKLFPGSPAGAHGADLPEGPDQIPLELPLGLLPGSPPGTSATYFRTRRGGRHTVPFTGVNGQLLDVRFKVKAAKPPKTPVVVDPGAPISTAAPGPKGAKAVRRTARRIAGFEVDSVELAWREVVTSGSGTGDNSVWRATAAGAKPLLLWDAFANDPDAQASGFAKGVPYDVGVEYSITAGSAAAIAAGGVHAATYSLPPEPDFPAPILLDAALGSPIRLLFTSPYLTLVRPDLLRTYAVGDANSDNDYFTAAPDTIEDLCLTDGYVGYALELASGDLEVGRMTIGVEFFLPLGTLGPAPTTEAIAARGGDVYLVTDEGDGSRTLRWFSVGREGAPVVLAQGLDSIRALAVDAWSVYAVEDDGTAGVRVISFPRGGGRGVVVAGSTADDTFLIDAADVACAAGYVYFQAHADGQDGIYRKKLK